MLLEIYFICFKNDEYILLYIETNKQAIVLFNLVIALKYDMQLPKTHQYPPCNMSAFDIIIETIFLTCNRAETLTQPPLSLCLSE